MFDYVDGAAEAEISLERARASFRDVVFRPRILRDVSTFDTAQRILGRATALRLVLAPTGFTRMMHHQGELAVARAAARALDDGYHLHRRRRRRRTRTVILLLNADCSCSTTTSARERHPVLGSHRDTSH